MPERSGIPGFAPPHVGKALSTGRTAVLELLATVTLAVSLVVAATAVSMGKRSFGHGILVVHPSALPSQ